jgi:predicted O-methyltransferase YrrM
MDTKLAELLAELETFGAENDRRVTERNQRMMNITGDTGEFLALLIRTIRARHVLEIGTSNGYSTLWLAYAIQPLKGKVTTLEILPEKTAMARTNFERIGLSSLIQMHLGDAGDFLRVSSPESFDMIFLDSSRQQYIGWWQAIQRILRVGGLLVVDNAVSHANEMKILLRSSMRHPASSHHSSQLAMANSWL